MYDGDTTREQLIADNAALRQRVARLEAAAITHRQVEAALQQSEHRYRHLMEHSLGLLCMHDLDGILLEINTAAARALGYRPQDGVRRSLREFLAPSVQHQFDEYLERIRKQPTDSGFLRVITRTGEERVWLYRNVRHEALNEPPYVAGHALDITEYMQAEGALKQAHEALLRREVERTAALHESQAQFRSLIEGSLQGILIHRDNKALFVNQACTDILGYETPEEIYNLDTLVSLIAPHDRDRLMWYRDARLAGQEVPAYYECQGVRKDNSLVWLDMTTRVVTWEGEPATQSIVVDITERKRAEEALRESEDRYRSVVEGSLQGILIHQDGILQYVNPACVRMFGYTSPDELQGTNLWETLFAPESWEEIQARIAALLRGEKIDVHMDFPGVRRDGSRIWISSIGSVITWQNQLAIVSFYTDVTVRKQAEEDRQRVNAQLRTEMAERRQAQEALLQAERLASLGTLAAGIAHELNNPLGAITMTAEHARNDLTGPDTPEGIRECLDDILKDAHRCAQTVKRTLHFARQGYPNKNVVDLHGIIENACNITRGYAKQHDVQLALTLAPASLRIRANAEEMELALVNLIRNAVEAGHHGAQVHLRTEVEAGQVQITVEDTGVGLTEEEQQYAFDPFYTTRPNAGGTGFGLSITHRIISNHQGTIDLCSQPGQGTIVRIGLPLAA